MAPEDVVVRGGEMKRSSIEDNADLTLLESGYRGLSVWSMPNRTAAEVAAFVIEQHGRGRLPHNKIRQSTVGEIEARGFELRASEPQPGHYDIVLPGPLTDEIFDLLQECFRPAEPKVAQKEREADG